MAIRLTRWTYLATLSALAIGVSVACGPIALPVFQSGSDSGGVANLAPAASSPAQTVAYVTPTPARARPGVLQPVPVRRDSLTETMSLDGTASPQAQEPINYPWRAIVDDVKVKVGQSVKQDDILIDFSQGDMPRNLLTARSALETAQSNLALAETQAQASQTATAQRIEADTQKQQQAVSDAQLALRRAQENLAIVRAGRPATERQQAQAVVIGYATNNLPAAQHALDVALAGADDSTIASAQREVESDTLSLGKAQSDLDALTRGPDPTVLRAAQAAVQRAQTQLQLAQAAKIDPKADAAVAKLQHDAAVLDAQTALDGAQAQVTKLKQPPTDVDVQSAKLRLADADATLSSAQAKLDALQAGPDPAAVSAARREVDNVQHAMAEAQAASDAVNNHPTPDELAQAEDQVRAAQTTLDNALQATPAAADAGPDLSALQKVVDQDAADVAAAEQALENSHLRAPFDGTVVSIKTKPGDTPAPAKPVVVLARQGPPIVRVDLDDTQAARLVAGQTANIQTGTGASAVNTVATVTSVTAAAQDGSTGASALLAPNWADGEAPRFGTPVQVTVNLGTKQDVLVVPRSAVHQTGGRAAVEVQDGTIRHLVSVQIGISTTDSVEIVSGLTEGQLVLAAPA